MWARLRAHIAARLSGRAIDEEVGEELRFHLEQETERLVAAGRSPADARRSALREMGGMASTMEAVRDTRSLGLHALWFDVRYGLRSLLSTPRFTLAALLTIVLTIGGISAVFTLVHSVLLRPLPYPEADRLVLVRAEDSERRGPSMTFDDLERLQAEARTLDEWAVFTPGYVYSLDADSENPIPVQDMRVTPSVFPMFGIEVVLGRPLLESDVDPASPDVALISHDLWQSRFGGTADVIGQLVTGRGDVARTIVGVTGPGATVPTNWIAYPLVWSPARQPYPNRSLVAVARLRDGATAEMASDELRAVDERLKSADPQSNPDRTVTALSLLDHIVGDTKPVLWMFFAAVSCVLLIGVANLLSLQTVRNAARDRELCVRAALGASRWRLVRQLLVETLMLGLAGGTLGVIAARVAVDAVVASLPPRFPRADAIGLDIPVVLFAAGVSAGVALVCGILPGWRASRPHLSSAMSEGGRSSVLSARRSRLQRMMIAVETALALMLLVGAGLLVNSFGRMMTEPAGMNEENLWSARISLPNRYRGDRTGLYWADVLRQVRALDQVASAAISINDGGPLTGGDIRIGGVRPAGVADTGQNGISLSMRNVSGEYLSTLGVPLLEGRALLDSDTPGGDRVAVLNELAASALWPGDSAVGKRLAGIVRGDATVVGVIPTFTITDIQSEPTPQVYLPSQQNSDFTTATVLFRARPDSTGIDQAVAAVARSLEPDAQVEVQTMTGVRWKQLAMERFRTTVLLVFAGTAVFLAIVGIFGVVSYSVVQRTREVGLRIALGATRGQVAGLLARQTLVPSALGLLVGTAAAIGLSRFLSAFLFGITPTDPATYVSAFALLALAATAAALLPARRVNAISPTEALRHE
jgi:predicted permease